MYERLVPMVRDGFLNDYDIIIDEVPKVVEMVTSKSKTSVQEFYLDAGCMDVDATTGLVRPTMKWWHNRDEVLHQRYSTLLRLVVFTFKKGRCSSGHYLSPS